MILMSAIVRCGARSLWRCRMCRRCGGVALRRTIAALMAAVIVALGQSAATQGQKPGKGSRNHQSGHGIILRFPR
jgi:hypothetical protein